MAFASAAQSLWENVDSHRLLTAVGLRSLVYVLGPLLGAFNDAPSYGVAEASLG
jgi:hypothetical protein